MTAPYIDVHCHLDYEQIASRISKVVENAINQGVRVMVSNGLDAETNRRTLELSKEYTAIKSGLGIYPPDAWHREKNKDKEFSFDSSELEKELRFIEEHKSSIVAIGEIGLDYKDKPMKDIQKKVFIEMVRLAKKIDKPVIVHSRKAEEDVINILEEQKIQKVILHCFCGKKSLIERASKLKFNFSIPTNVVRAENIQGIVKMVPLSQLFCETDSPFLSPFKEKMNEPAFVIESYKKIAEIKGVTVEEVRNIVYMNYQRVFC